MCPTCSRRRPLTLCDAASRRRTAKRRSAKEEAPDESHRRKADRGMGRLQGVRADADGLHEPAESQRVPEWCGCVHRLPAWPAVEDGDELRDGVAVADDVMQILA